MYNVLRIEVELHMPATMIWKFLHSAFSFLSTFNKKKSGNSKGTFLETVYKMTVVEKLRI